jgi:hypothetical protein
MRNLKPAYHQQKTCFILFIARPRGSRFVEQSLKSPSEFAGLR